MASGRLGKAAVNLQELPWWRPRAKGGFSCLFADAARQAIGSLSNKDCVIPVAPREIHGVRVV
eukprot:15457731-Alexandrium_andersonii.AAC.1